MIPPRTFLLLLASMLSASAAAALSLTAITPSDGATGVCADTPVRLTFDADVRLGAVGTVQLVDAATGRVLYQQQARSLVTGPFPIAMDRRGRVWAGTNGEGLYLVEALRSPTPARRLTELDGLSGSLVRELLEDRDGNIWVGKIGRAHV